METVRLRPLCYKLGFNSSRIEQWISRGYFQPDEASVPGRARELTKSDAVKLLTLVELVDAGFDASKVYEHLQYLHLLKTETYLVLSSGRLFRIIAPTSRGSAASDNSKDQSVYVPGRLSKEIVSREDLLNIISDSNRHVSIVVNLDNIANRVDKAWDEMRADSQKQDA